MNKIENDRYVLCYMKYLYCIIYVNQYIYMVSVATCKYICWEHIRCKSIFSCKPQKLQSRPSDQHLRDTGGFDNVTINRLLLNWLQIPLPLPLRPPLNVDLVVQIGVCMVCNDILVCTDMFPCLVSSVAQVAQTLNNN